MYYIKITGNCSLIHEPASRTRDLVVKGRGQRSLKKQENGSMSENQGQSEGTGRSFPCR